MFTTAPWVSLSHTADPELQVLTRKLQLSLMHSRADSTTKKYFYAFERWRVWAEKKPEIQVFPVIQEQFCLYLQLVGDLTQSSVAVKEAVSALSWLHQLAGTQPLSSSPLVASTLAALTKIWARPTKKKEPVTADMLSKIVDTMEQQPSLTEVRTATICLLAYSGFLRADELIKLQCNDIEFFGDHMKVHIRSSKTDQLRKGDKVMIARLASTSCPVRMLEKYCQLGGIDLASSSQLFRGISKSKSGEKLRRSGAISYTRLRELIKQKLQQLGYNEKEYGMHSLRAGGATAAANAHVPERLFKRHGRWRSENAKDGYIKDSDEDMLQVSKKLNI